MSVFPVSILELSIIFMKNFDTKIVCKIRMKNVCESNQIYIEEKVIIIGFHKYLF